MRTILVTGGAGFIGSAFVRRTIADMRDVRVVNLDALTYAGNLDSLAPVSESAANDARHVFVEGDIADQSLVAELLGRHRPESIVNFAAESHVDRSIDGPEAFVNTNVLGTFRLLDAARGYWKQLAAAEQAAFRFLHVSTDEVYGSLGADDAGFTEETSYAPNSPYSASKAASDHFVRAYHHTYGLPTLITNCSNNYGPYQFPEKLVPLMILNAVEGKPLPVYGNGANVRDWLFVDDHCAAIHRVLAQGTPGEVYNIGGGCERTNLEVVEAICATVDRLKGGNRLKRGDRLKPGLAHAPAKSLITFVKDRPGHDQRYAIDSTKIRTQLGWTPQQDFESGLELTIQWYLNNDEWVERVTSGKYRRERLGLASGAAT